MNQAAFFPLLFLVMTLQISACSEEDFDLSSDSSVNNPSNNEEIPQWLEAHHEIDPADWMIIRSQAALAGEVTSHDHRQNLLKRASEHFRESPRMIANRAVQLEDMLLEIGIEESAVSLIDHFTHLPTVGTPHNFSAYCQYYFNIRAKGYPQGYALTELSKLK
ncbi:MAG: hypothetical protein VYB22_06160 [Pseudomonadota bacterium]|nr:hypothetical protein [Pseudomonadota bacterium]